MSQAMSSAAHNIAGRKVHKGIPDYLPASVASYVVFSF